MFESDQPESLPQGPVRIVYHTGNRTFARLFNERSLEEVKDVVRKKLGLGSGADVSLKQMGSDALLDLEDDGDFQAFRVFLKSSVSVDIQVTVGESQGSTVPPAVSNQSRAQPSDSEGSIALTSTSKEPGGLTSTPPITFLRKRPLPSSDKPPVRVLASITSTPVASGTPAESPASVKPVGDVEPPKKKQRKEPTEEHAPSEPIAATPAAPQKTAQSLGTPKPAGDAEPPKKKTRKEPVNKSALSGPTVVTRGESGKTTESLVPPKTAGDTEPSKKKMQKEPVVTSASPEPIIVAREESGKTAEVPATPKGAGDVEPPKKKSGKEGQLPEPVPVTPVTSGKAAESSTATKSVGDVEPPKKKTKKGPTKTKSTEQPAAEHTGTPDTSTRVAESPAAPVPATPAEPLKKKTRKVVKAKDSKTTESPATKVSASKPTPKKSTDLSISSLVQEVGPSKPKDTETSGSSVKKVRMQPRRGGIPPTMTRVYKLNTMAVDEDDTEKPVEEAGISVNEAAESGGDSETSKDDWTEWLRVPMGKVCASIPQTGASKRVRSEVAAAILSGYVSKLPEPEPPAPAKRKTLKRDTKKSSASSSALPAKLTTVLDTPANEVPNVLTEHRDEQVTPPEPPEQTNLNDPSCPICLEPPFHIRYYCPIVLKGPDAIRERLEEAKRTNLDKQRSLVKQLEGLLREFEVTPQPSWDVVPTDGVQSGKALPNPKASLSTSEAPGHSYPSEVTVQGRDEGSSSDSSDSTSDGEDEPQVSSPPQKQKTSGEQPLPSNDDMEAIIRGPVPQRQSILNLIDRIAGESDSDSDSDEDPAELEEDADEEIGRSRTRSFIRLSRSSDSESEEAESSSPSPLRSVEVTSTNPGPGVQCSNKSVEKSSEHQKEDVVMHDSVDPPVLETQDDDDSSEETHVGSEDRMAVDESIEEKGGVEEHPVHEASVLEPLDAPTNGVQVSATTQVDHGPDRDVAEVSKEVEADPIEPADDLESPVASNSSNGDPIEVPLEDSGSIFTDMTQSAPKPGVSKRIKTRNGQVPDDEADRPVLLEQLGLGTVDEVNLIIANGRLRRVSSISQEPASGRKTLRVNTHQPSRSTPAAVALLNYRSRSGARTGNGVKMPATQSQESKDDDARIAPAPSLVRWETLAEPLSPSVQLGSPPVPIDELMSSSPHPENTPIRSNKRMTRGQARKTATPSQAESSQKKDRLFDLTPSQVPFPYSQNYTDSAPATLVDGKERVETSESEEERKIVKRKTKTPTRYRPLSQLASQATLFSPSLPTPTNKSMTNGKSKKLAVDSSSSSSSSDGDEEDGSSHIPRGRRAGSVLETATKKKRMSLLSRMA